MYDALDGLRDVSDVARACKLTEFETSKALCSLSTVGLVRARDLAEIYRAFLTAQNRVLRERFGEEVAEKLVSEVTPRISPTLRDTLAEYRLTDYA